MFTDLAHIPEAWSTMFRNRSFRNQFFITLLVFVLVCAHDFHYLRIWQSRQGNQINDIILNHLPPHNFSLPIFMAEYSTMLLVFIFLFPYPVQMVRGFQMTAVILLARTMAIYFVPLEPPRDMILLNDPLATFFLHTKQVMVTKDLFFSGHISMLALLCLLATNRYLRVWSILATVAAGFMLMCQHVHYSPDVFFAPVVAFASYKFVLYIHRETGLGTELSRQGNSHWHLK